MWYMNCNIIKGSCNGGFIVGKLYWRIPHLVDAVWVVGVKGGERGVRDGLAQ